VVTDLRGRTTPLLRYETGDLALAVARSCPCGRPSPLVGTIEGRAVDVIRLADGRFVTPRTVSDHMATMLPPDSYRLCQEQAGCFTLHLEGDAPDSLVAHLRRLLGDVEVKVIAGVPAGAGRGKSRPVVSRLTTTPRPRSPVELRDGPGP
jgi:phenylacetate-coenzyme A ligase PaaK-like adenylate-forming protein